MTQINLTHAAFARAMSDVDVGAERLRRDRYAIDRRVTGYLGSGWTGVAADSFVEAWEEWKVAAGEVLEGLRAMGQLLDAAHRDFVQTDEASQAALDQLAARLVDRLEG